MSDILGLFTRLIDLPAREANLVHAAMKAPDRAYCFQSNFPVGSAILACDSADAASEKMFVGCNVENVYFPATICAERNAVTTAVMEGYTRLTAAAVFCKKYPGGSPCGVCRQVLTQFGRGGTLLNIVDLEGSVRRAMIDDLLPAAIGPVVSSADQTAYERKLARNALANKHKSHVPYSRNARGAIFVAYNSQGKRRSFNGAAIDNASYGASVSCESVAMMAARMAGYVNQPTLVVTTTAGAQGPDMHNPIDGECLQILREFGRDATVLIVGDDASLIRSNLVELLPDSFGPEAL